MQAVLHAPLNMVKLQMHRRVCILERDKGTLENRLGLAVKKTERYFDKIKELETEKLKVS